MAVIEKIKKLICNDIASSNLSPFLEVVFSVDDLYKEENLISFIEFLLSSL